MPVVRLFAQAAGPPAPRPTSWRVTRWPQVLDHARERWGDGFSAVLGTCGVGERRAGGADRRGGERTTVAVLPGVRWLSGSVRRPGIHDVVADRSVGPIPVSGRGAGEAGTAPHRGKVEGEPRRNPEAIDIRRPDRRRRRPRASSNESVDEVVKRSSRRRRRDRRARRRHGRSRCGRLGSVAVERPDGGSPTGGPVPPSVPQVRLRILLVLPGSGGRHRRPGSDRRAVGLSFAASPPGAPGALVADRAPSVGAPSPAGRWPPPAPLATGARAVVLAIATPAAAVRHQSGRRCAAPGRCLRGRSFAAGLGWPTWTVPGGIGVGGGAAAGRARHRRRAGGRRSPVGRSVPGAGGVGHDAGCFVGGAGSSSLLEGPG